MAEDPNVPFHVTPTDSAWLHHGEIWFGQIECNVIARGIFTSSGIWRTTRSPSLQQDGQAMPFLAAVR